MAAILGETKFFFKNWDGSGEIPCVSKILSKSRYLAQFSRYKQFCDFGGKNLKKIKNGRDFGRDKIFLKIAMATLERYPVVQRFRRNRSI